MMDPSRQPREFKEIPVGLIDDPELPSRTQMDDEKMSELVASIRANGLLQPIMVYRQGERFRVIAGHRRLIACARAGLAVMPAIIYPSADAGHIARQYAENRFREDLNPGDEAILFAELLERDCNGDVDTLAARLDEKRAYVEGRLILLRDAEILAAVQSGQLPKIGVALELLKLPDPNIRRVFLDAAIRGGATVTLAARWVAEWKEAQRSESGGGELAAAAPSPNVQPNLDYFRCVVCRKSDNVHLMQPLQIHTHCKLAILDDFLASYHGEK
jgi:ParB family transcriptional regulator, chromosome partitioning protein